MLALAVLVLASSVDVSPVAKVVELLHSLQTQTQEEGTAEAATYDTFACFCKDTTDTKVSEISDKETSVQTLTADEAQLMATRDSLKADITDLTNEIAQMELDLKTMTELREKEHAEYTVAYADLHKADDSLERAIAELSGSKMSFRQVKALVQPIFAFANAMSLIPTGSKMSRTVVSSFLQEAPEGAPEIEDQDYSFHSDDIIGTLNGLLATFKEKKNTVESEEEAAANSFDSASGAKRDEISTSTDTKETKEGELSSAESDLATTTEDLTETNALLADDRTYLKGLTDKCEKKAHEWDQRSAMRTEELKAIAQAVEIIEGTVAGKAEASGAGGREAAPSAAQDALAAEAGFLQIKSVAVRHVSTASAEASKPRNRVISLLRSKATNLKSTALTSLVLKLAADPFAKVKDLIQKLITRLLTEATNEATHKGWCDTELGKSKHSRDSRHSDVSNLNAATQELEARKVSLGQEKETLSTDLLALRAALQTAIDNRAAEKTDNVETVKNANEGITALASAIQVLSDFYKEGAKAAVLAQQSPVEQDMADAGTGGFSGAYKGNQAQGTGIIGMLETIMSDFKRTVSETEGAEDQANRDHVAFSKETNVSIATKQRGLEQTENDLTMCNGDLSAALQDLQSQQELLDVSLETLEKLRPACIDTGMSFEERTSRREAEIAALKNALTILSEEDGFLQK